MGQVVLFNYKSGSRLGRAMDHMIRESVDSDSAESAESALALARNLNAAVTVPYYCSARLSGAYTFHPIHVLYLMFKFVLKTQDKKSASHLPVRNPFEPDGVTPTIPVRAR